MRPPVRRHKVSLLLLERLVHVHADLLLGDQEELPGLLELLVELPVLLTERVEEIAFLRQPLFSLFHAPLLLLQLLVLASFQPQFLVGHC